MPMLVETTFASGVSPVSRNASRMSSASRPAMAGLVTPGSRTANSSPPSRAMIWRSPSTAVTRDACRGAEKVVDFLEPVGVEAQHGEAFALGQGGDFLVDPAVEVAAIGQ